MVNDMAVADHQANVRFLESMRESIDEVLSGGRMTDDVAIGAYLGMIEHAKSVKDVLCSKDTDAILSVRTNSAMAIVIADLPRHITVLVSYPPPLAVTPPPPPANCRTIFNIIANIRSSQSCQYLVWDSSSVFGKTSALWCIGKGQGSTHVPLSFYSSTLGRVLLEKCEWVSFVLILPGCITPGVSMVPPHTHTNTRSSTTSW